MKTIIIGNTLLIVDQGQESGIRIPESEFSTDNTSFQKPEVDQGDGDSVEFIDIMIVDLWMVSFIRIQQPTLHFTERHTTTRSTEA